MAIFILIKSVLAIRKVFDVNFFPHFIYEIKEDKLQ